MSIEIYRRPANVTLKVARAELAKAIGPRKRIASIEIDPATKEIVAEVKPRATKRKAAPLGDVPPAPVEDGLDAADDVDIDVDLPKDDLGGGDMAEVLDLLREIADAVGAGKGDLDDDLDGGLDDLGPVDDAPLPPPAEEPHHDGHFASLNAKVASSKSFTVERAEATDVTNAEIAKEVMAGFPGAKIARILRNKDRSLARIELTRD